LTTAAPPAANGPNRDSSRTVVEYAIDSIRHGIFEGHYSPGQRLIEADLTQALGVSRGPLREALRRLAADGMVEIEPYRGAAVARMSRAELADTLAVREVLEGLAAGLAARRIDEAGKRAKAERAADALQRSASRPDILAYHQENDRFHALIVELSGNGALARQLAQVQLPALRAAFFRVLEPKLLEESVAQHRDIIDAVLKGDAVRAERAMRAHVRRTHDHSHRLPDALFRG
jgi:DNA-binding GntR family transcriptional regulator